MKRFKLLLTSMSFVLASFAPVFLSASAHAATTTVPVNCPVVIQDGEFTQVDNNNDSCDLIVDKQVSVNGGAYIEADSSGTAANAYVGDTVTYKITVTNNSGDLTPHGAVYIQDVLPASVTFQSFTASDGNYIGNDGSFFANNWYLPTLKSDGGSGFVTTLPATLTITTTASTVGLAQNTATLSKYDPGSCDGGCVYGDADASNDSNDAWINVQSKPQVLGSSTGDPQVLAGSVVNTGNGAVTNLVAGLVLLGGLAVVSYGRFRKTHYKV